MKAIIFVLAIASISCQVNKLFDLNKMADQGTLLQFLSEAGNLRAGGYPVTISDCTSETKARMKITQMKVSPTEVIKGKDIGIKVKGVMLEDQVVQKIHLDTYFNGGVIFQDNVDKGNTQVKKGVYAFDYNASVPTFTPSGKWEIRVWLVNDANDNIACVKAEFNTA